MKKSSHDMDIRAMGKITKKSRPSKVSRKPSLYNDHQSTSSTAVRSLQDINKSCSSSTTLTHGKTGSRIFALDTNHPNSDMTNCDSVSVAHSSQLPVCEHIKQELQQHSLTFQDVNNSYTSLRFEPVRRQLFQAENIDSHSFHDSDPMSGSSGIYLSPNWAVNGVLSGNADTTCLSLPDMVLSLEQQLCSELLQLDYTSPVSHIYNPIEYAIEPHKQFLHRYCSDYKEILFLGMNPGPYGMAQTGVRP